MQTEISTLPKVNAKQRVAVLASLKAAREERAEANSVYDPKQLLLEKQEIDYAALQDSNGRKFVEVDGERAYLHRTVTPDTDAVSIVLMEAREDKTFTIANNTINVAKGQQKLVAYPA